MKKRSLTQKIAAMSSFVQNLPLIIFIVTFFLLSATVRSSPNPIILSKLSSDQGDDICPSVSGANSCPIKCFRADPVCGEDNVTYWCGCPDARCAGVRVKKIGFCEVGNGGSGPAGQALLLVHIVWLILLGVFLLFGLL